MVEDNFSIIDPHHPLWDLEKHRYPWLQRHAGGSLLTTH